MNLSSSQQVLALALLMMVFSPALSIQANNAVQVAACELSKQEQEAFDLLKQLLGGKVMNFSKFVDKILSLLSGNPRYIELCKLLREVKNIKTAKDIGDKLQKFCEDTNKIKEIPADIVTQLKAHTDGLAAKAKLLLHLKNCLKAK